MIRRGLPALLAVLLVAAVPACATRPIDCRVPEADVASVAGWVGYAVRHPEDVAFVFDDGRGTRVEHRAGDEQPFASSIKVLNLVAYTRAVALGAVRPDEPVRVGDWERWSSAGSEESHAAALDALDVPRAGMRAADPARRCRSTGSPMCGARPGDHRAEHASRLRRSRRRGRPDGRRRRQPRDRAAARRRLGRHRGPPRPPHVPCRHGPGRVDGGPERRRGRRGRRPRPGAAAELRGLPLSG